MWCSDTVLQIHTHLKLLDPVVSSARSLTGYVFKCDIAHLCSVAVICTLYKSMCNPIHHHCCALPVPYVPVQVTRDDLIAHRYTYAPPRCRTSQHRKTFISISVSLRNDLANPVFDGVGLVGLKAVSTLFYWPKMLAPFLSLLPSISLLSFYRLVLWGWGLRTIGCKSLAPSIALSTCLNNVML